MSIAEFNMWSFFVMIERGSYYCEIHFLRLFRFHVCCPCLAYHTVRKKENAFECILNKPFWEKNCRKDNKIYTFVNLYIQFLFSSLRLHSTLEYTRNS